MLSCDFCLKKFSRKDALTRHMRVHTGEKPFKCDLCGKAFTQKCNLIIHEMIHTGEKPYTCDTCDKAFLQQSSLTVHKRIHTGEKPFSCGTCGKAFCTNSELTVHMRIHTGEKPYSCDICKKSYNDNSNLLRHNKSTGHLKKLESTKNTVSSSASTRFVDCDEAYINPEIKKEETLDEDPIFVKMEAESVEVIIKEEIKEEGEIENEEFV